MGLLEGKVAIVTGAGRGIGRGEALLLAQEGARVVVNDLGTELDGEGKDTNIADQVVAEIKGAGGEAVANYDSVAEFQGAKRMIGVALKKFGRLDILVNNAGITRPTLPARYSESRPGTLTFMRHGRLLKLSPGMTCGPRRN